jgi:hypothetical protein
MKSSHLYTLIGVVTAWFVLTLTLIPRENYTGAMVTGFVLLWVSVGTMGIGAYFEGNRRSPLPQ